MTRTLLASLLFLASCSAAQADQIVAPAPHGPVIAVAPPAKVRAPYDVQILRDNGDVLPTYTAQGRFYVQGNAGERYVLRVTNPTPNRVEAVVTVDGLDVIDGEPGDLHKRGYIVPAYGETRIQGFRTSQDNVATFRFSSVDDSYAGQKGIARNVGVVAVALFEEQPPPQIVAPPPPPPPVEVEDDAARDDGAADGKGMGPRPARGEPPYGRPRDIAPEPSPAAPAMPPPPPVPRPRVSRARPHPVPKSVDDAPASTNRPGLGTAFGEQRYASVMYTSFERAADRPIAIAELRYNDAPGLVALGIHLAASPDEGEIMTRETADPFPGDRGYARPPR